jgi:hypothetical protein
MRDDLFLGPTVIGGDTTPHDYQVFWNDLPIPGQTAADGPPWQL